VNQCWWRERAAFQELLDVAKRVKEGALDAVPAHKAALARLRAAAATCLEEIGNAAGEPTLRRVETSLAAIAAAGGFDPDPPGALTDDREPSGFLALGIAPGGHVEPPPPPPALTVVPPPPPSVPPPQTPSPAPTREDAENAHLGELEAKKKAAAAQAEAAAAAREKQAAIEAARADVMNAAASVSSLEGQLADARKVLDAARARLDALQNA
jgi:hypothetical protein